MAKGKKTGGRVAGTPNKISTELRLRGLELLEQKCDPISVMIGILEHPDCSLELRSKVAADLAKYLYVPKKAVEVSGPGGGKLEIVVRRIGQ